MMMRIIFKLSLQPEHTFTKMMREKLRVLESLLGENSMNLIE